MKRPIVIVDPLDALGGAAPSDKLTAAEAALVAKAPKGACVVVVRHYLKDGRRVSRR